MKKPILIFALLLSILSFSQTFEKAIISNNTHIYDAVNNVECRMIMAIAPNRGVQFSDDKITVYTQVFGLVEGELLELREYSKKIEYTRLEVDAIYNQLDDPIEIGESFMTEFSKLLETVLLSETLRKEYFGGDGFTIYNE